MSVLLAFGGFLAGFVVVAAVCAIGGVVTWRLRRYLRRDETPQEVPPGQTREDMIFIWTSIHGIPRERAEAMYEEYERATTAGSLGLRGK